MLKKNLNNYIFNYYLEERVFVKAFFIDKLNAYDEEVKQLEILEAELLKQLEEQSTTTAEEQPTTTAEEQPTTTAEVPEAQATLIIERVYKYLDKFKEFNLLEEFDFFLENGPKNIANIINDDELYDINEEQYIFNNIYTNNFSRAVIIADFFCLFESYSTFYNLKYELFKVIKKKFKRKVKRKLRFKRLKRVRKFRIFKRLLKRKKIVIKIKKFTSKSIISYKKNKIKKPTHLFQKVTLTQRMVQNINLFFFYKLNSHLVDDFNTFTGNLEAYSTGVEDFKKFKIMLRNYQRKPYWKLRTARITHWSLFFKKTIRQTRYKSFIVRYIKHLGIYKLNVSNLLNYFTYYKVS